MFGNRARHPASLTVNHEAKDGCAVTGSTPYRSETCRSTSNPLVFTFRYKTRPEFVPWLPNVGEEIRVVDAKNWSVTSTVGTIGDATIMRTGKNSCQPLIPDLPQLLTTPQTEIERGDRVTRGL